MEQTVEEGAHVIVSFSSLNKVSYSAYSTVASGNGFHYYVKKRLAIADRTVNISFVILFSGSFVFEFSCPDTHDQECIVGYELNVEYYLS